MPRRKRPTARDENGLAVTCPASRHAEMIAEELIKHGSCGQLADEGKHAGQSILSAVRSLYAARAEIARLVAEVERHRMTEEERDVLEKVWPDYAANNDDAGCAHIEATIHGYLVRTEQEQKTIRWIGKQGEDH